MSYVLKTTNKKGDEVFIHTNKCTVYCPELAAKYDERKTALAMRLKLLNAKCFKNIEVVDYTYDLMITAHHKYRHIGEAEVDKIIDDIKKSFERL